MRSEKTLHERSANLGSGQGFFNGRRFLLVLGLLLAVAFPKVILGIDTFFYRDYGVLGYPYGAFFRDSVFHGQLPLWNPYSHCGVPFLAQWGCWYPPAMLALLLPMPWSVNVLLLVHLAIGGYGIFWLVRRLGLSEYAGAFAGVAYVFNGVSLSCFLWGNYIACLAWLPWVIGCVMESWKTGGRWIVIAAVVSALQVLTASPEITLLSWLLIGMLWLAEAAAKKKHFWPGIRRILAVVVIAAALTMIQMLPFFDLLHHAQRTSNYGTQKWAMAGWGWANLFVPLFHSYQAPDGLWFQTDQDFLASYYLGMGVMAFAATGVWLRRSAITLVFAGMSLFCWIMALGDSGLLYHLIRQAIPFIGFARYPVKCAIPTAFLISVLSAFGIDAIAKNFCRGRRALFVVSTAFIFLTGLFLWIAWAYPFSQDNWFQTAKNAAWRILFMVLVCMGATVSFRMQTQWKRWGVQTGVLICLFLDAISHSPRMIPTASKSLLVPGMWEAGTKNAPPKLGEARIMISTEAEDKLLWSMVTNKETDFIGKRLAEWSNLNLIDRVPKVNGAMTLRPAYFDRLEQFMYFTAGTKFGYGLADFLSVEWISSPNNAAQWVQRSNFLPLITGGQRAVFVNDDDALANITALNFDPRQSVYLPESARTSITATNRTGVILNKIDVQLNKVEADFVADSPGLVVLSQSYYHLWRAFVDDNPQPLVRANLAFQAVQVPAGEHHLRIVYRDWNLIIGAVISFSALLFCGWYWSRASNAKMAEQSIPDEKSNAPLCSKVD